MNKIIIIAVLVACGAVAYYFVVELPAQNKAKIALEQQKIQFEQQRVYAKEALDSAMRIAAENKEQARKDDLNACIQTAETEANQIITYNGKHTGNGVYVAAKHYWTERDQKRRDGFATCERLYGTLQ